MAELRTKVAAMGAAPAINTGKHAALSTTFILGVLPLAVATGAGSGAQRAIGIDVMGGMIAATALGVFFVPLFYVVVRRISGIRLRRKKEPKAQGLPAE